jgi:hypothetical protein
LTLKITASAAGNTWVVIDFIEFIYMTNGSVVIVRDPLSGTYSESTSYDSADAAENFNGQVMLGGF